MRNAYLRAATLADFVFALIGLCISCALRPMDTYFPTDRGNPTAISPHCAASFTCASCHFFPQRPVVEWYERSALKWNICGRILSLSSTKVKIFVVNFML
jgi:hypothetical protein